ncbi:hypothetical protein [Nocardia sp. NPDC059195]|uniref:hypothetical protein n=1 Tax=Nocardia sp. NPDC059195 TaxID=3346765 RepID=UPI003686B7AB
MRALAGPGGLNSAPPFTPIADVDPLPDESLWRREVVRRAGDLQVIIGATADEMGAFYGGPHSVFSRIRRLPFGPRIASEIQQLIGRKAFEDGTAELADLLATHDADVYRYRVHDLHPSNPFGPCHCLELLFRVDGNWPEGGAQVLGGQMTACRPPGFGAVLPSISTTTCWTSLDASTSGALDQLIPSRTSCRTMAKASGWPGYPDSGPVKPP